MEIRKLESYEEIYTIIKQCSDNFYNQDINNDYDITRLAKKYSLYSNVFGAYQDDIVNGMVSYYINSKSKEAYISIIVVKRGCEGQGIGKTILQKVCDECINKGMDRLSLHVAAGNENAINFYIRNGFENVCKEDNGTLKMCRLFKR